jgi:hypothetical protein
MKALQTIGCWTVAVTLAAMVAPQSALAEEGDPNKITEQEKKTFRDLVDGRKAKEEGKVRLVRTIGNARQIGLALFEFENEYGEYPNEKTALDMIKVRERLNMAAAEVKAATANDCFFQLIAADFLRTDRVFSFDEAPAAPEKQEKPKALERVEKCSFALVSLMNAAGDPGRPLLVTPLVNGKTTFDPQVLGGKAVILFCENSVRSFPIEPDGRVLMNGKDIFDPAQPFWKGKVPPIKWPAK